jgi:hypothetical protein
MTKCKDGYNCKHWGLYGNESPCSECEDYNKWESEE